VTEIKTEPFLFAYVASSQANALQYKRVEGQARVHQKLLNVFWFFSETKGNVSAVFYRILNDNLYSVYSTNDTCNQKLYLGK